MVSPHTSVLLARDSIRIDIPTITNDIRKRTFTHIALSLISHSTALNSLSNQHLLISQPPPTIHTYTRHHNTRPISTHQTRNTEISTNPTTLILISDKLRSHPYAVSRLRDKVPTLHTVSMALLRTDRKNRTRS